MEFPKYIRMKPGYYGVERILTRWDDGAFCHIIHKNEKGQCITHTTIETGDYCGFDTHMGQDYLKKNPDLWDPCTPQECRTFDGLEKARKERHR